MAEHGSRMGPPDRRRAAWRESEPRNAKQRASKSARSTRSRTTHSTCCQHRAHSKRATRIIGLTDEQKQSVPDMCLESRATRFASMSTTNASTEAWPSSSGCSACTQSTPHRVVAELAEPACPLRPQRKAPWRAAMTVRSQPAATFARPKRAKARLHTTPWHRCAPTSACRGGS